ncbi:hypothetical protein JCM10207_001735 [Rhodosporidiobolus poonsookiae]
MASLALDAARGLLLRRHDTTTYTASEMAEMLIDPYEKTPKYAKAAVGVLCGLVAIFGLFNALAALLRTKLGPRLTRTRAYRRSVALYRWVETSQPRAIGWIRFPTTGAILLVAAFWLFILIWSLAVQPYYRSRWNVGSPPLAMRTGLMAVGVFPFILALGAKWNIIGFIVGVSHEKLQVFHQWLSHLFLILSLLHTFPFVVQGTHEYRPNADGRNPLGYSQLMWSWHVKHSVYYWSGIAALIPLAWLCWGSLTPLRNRFYEIFKLLHIVSAILFSAFFYIHCNNLLTSWHYLFATAAVYFTSVVMRFGLMLVRNGRHIPSGRVEVLADNAVRVTIRLPYNSPHRWTAGQHYFVNFVKVLPFESHPYTVSNAPYADASSTATADRLVLVFRINPKVGLGPRLLRLAESSSPTTPVLLDGPYGGLINRDIGRHNTVVLLAGGAGMSFTTAVLDELAGRLLREDPSVAGLKRIEVHWAIKREDAATWFDEQLDRTLEHLKSRKGLVSLNLYVTDDVRSPSVSAAASLAYGDKPEGEESSEKGCRSCSKPSSTLVPWTIYRERPSVSALLNTLFTSAPSGSTVGITSCGPTSLTTDVRRAVARRQREMAFGQTRGEGVQEVELHTEEFDW